MGGFLGVIAGGGMLLLIGSLFFAFLRQAGAIKPGQAKRLGMAAGMTLGLGLAYWLLGGLFYGVLFEPVAGIAEFNAIFRTAGLEKMYIALENPAFYGLFSGIFAYLGHFLGRILFGQYLFAGVVLALCMTLASVFLLMSRMEMILGEKEAQNGAICGLLFRGKENSRLPVADSGGGLQLADRHFGDFFRRGGIWRGDGIMELKEAQKCSK